MNDLVKRYECYIIVLTKLQEYISSSIKDIGGELNKELKTHIFNGDGCYRLKDIDPLLDKFLVILKEKNYLKEEVIDACISIGRYMMMMDIQEELWRLMESEKETLGLLD